MHQKLCDLRPTCLICNKPVDYFESTEACDRKELIFMVKCHGDIEIVFIDGDTLIGATRITPGVAFSNKEVKNDS